jgi:hypothetical protein
MSLELFTEIKFWQTHKNYHNVYTFSKYMLHAMQALRGERKYSSYLPLSSALDRGEWSALFPGYALPPGKGLPITTLDGPQCWFGHRLEEEFLASARY